MDVVITQDCHFFGADRKPGDRLALPVVVAEQVLERGLGVIVEADGSVRRRRGRPTREEESLLAEVLGTPIDDGEGEGEGAKSRRKRYANRMLTTDI